jgi:hypothetical protein
MIYENLKFSYNNYHYDICIYDMEKFHHNLTSMHKSMISEGSIQF